MNIKKMKIIYIYLSLLVLVAIFIFIGYKLDKRDKNTDTQSEHLSDPQDEKSNNHANDEKEEDKPLSPDQEFFVSAVEDFENKNYANAIIKLNQAIALNPKNSSYYSLKSEAQILLKQIEEAKKTLETGIMENPDSEILNSKLDTLEKDYYFPEDLEGPTRG